MTKLQNAKGKVMRPRWRGFQLEKYHATKNLLLQKWLVIT